MIQTLVSLSHYGPISIEIQRIDIWTDNQGRHRRGAGAQAR